MPIFKTGFAITASIMPYVTVVVHNARMWARSIESGDDGSMALWRWLFESQVAIVASRYRAPPPPPSLNSHLDTHDGNGPRDTGPAEKFLVYKLRFTVGVVHRQ